jgi:predicted phosphodiesterase
MPGVEEMRGVLLVNPGSPTYPRNMDRSLGTIGFLELNDRQARGWIEQLK